MVRNKLFFVVLILILSGIIFNLQDRINNLFFIEWVRSTWRLKSNKNNKSDI